MRLSAGLILALASALAINWSFFTQHGASSGLPQLSLRHAFHSLRLLFTSGRWLLGYAVGIGGWGLYIAALFFAPISLVQAVSAGGIGVIALLVLRSTGAGGLPRRDLTAVAACLGGLALVLVSFVVGVPKPAPPATSNVLVWVGATVFMAAVAWLVAGRVLRRGAGLGAAAGLLYAAGDVSTKGAVIAGLIFVPVLIVCHVLGFVTLQLAFQRGSAIATAGMSTLLNNALPIVAGVVAFHERLPAGGFGAVRVAGFALVVAGASLLARPEPAADNPADAMAVPAPAGAAVSLHMRGGDVSQEDRMGQGTPDPAAER